MNLCQYEVKIVVVNFFRCRTDEISYVKDAIINVKGEEDLCSLDIGAIEKFLNNDDNWFYVATIDEKVCGYAIAYRNQRVVDVNDMMCLYEIGTLKRYRRMGIGRRIINKIIDDGKLNKIMKIWIPTNISNKGACALYESIGAKGSDVKDDIIYTYRY